jgi:hypothetical protein
MLHGGADPRATRAQARVVFDALPGRKQFVDFPGVEHRSLYRESPDAWTRAVDAFLTAVAAGR